MRHIVLGLGEVGTAIQKILECDGWDKKNGEPVAGKYDVLHICFPWYDTDPIGFVGDVIASQLFYEADMVIVHSSVPVGTCDANNWVHSPVRGVHPNLEEGIRTFTKYFGGARAEEAGMFFNKIAGIQTVIEKKAATTEALKLWDTTQYGIMIALEKQIHAYCERHDLDFYTVYEHANRTYNEGYTRLGRTEVVRPYLTHKEGPIGGHCVIPNARILYDQDKGYASLVDELLDFNDALSQNSTL